MRRTMFLCVTAAIVSTFGVAVRTAHAQNDASAAAVLESQTALIRRVFAELGSASPQRRLFDLWMADLLLSSSQGPIEPAGVEDVVAAGALDTLQQLERTEDAEIRNLARSLRARLTAVLDVDNASSDTAVPVNLVGSNRVSLKRSDYERWITIRTQPGRQYELEARGCSVLRAIAVAGDRRRAIAGGTAFGSRFSFVGKADETAFIRIRTPFCSGDRGLSISSGPVGVTLKPSPTKDMAQPVTPGSTYHGRLADGEEQWLRFDAKAGERYEISTTPENDELDTFIYVYNADGEIASDDDGGVNLGSKLNLERSVAETLRIKIHAIDGAGTYEFAVLPKPSPVASAKPVLAPSTSDGTISDPSAEQWWLLDAQPDKRYTVEAIPGGDLDTVITIFDSDGIKELARDDDSGDGVGSRVVYTNRTYKSLLVRVHSADDTSGEYTLSVSDGATLMRLEAAPTAVTARPVTAKNVYQGSLTDYAQQWVRLETRASRTYVLETSARDVDTEITVYEPDGTTEIGSDDDGGTGLGSLLEVSRSSDRPLLVKISRHGSDRGDYELSVSDKPSPLEVAKPALIGRPNQGTLTTNRDEWWTVPAEAGTLVFEAVPSAGLDTVLTVYEPDGMKELKSDDDGGIGNGSKLELASASARTLLVKVSRLGSAGTYRLEISARRPPSEVAKPVAPGMTYQGSLQTERETWWSLDAQAGRIYVFEATPEGPLDTVITVYDPDGVTELASDDDGGKGLGSRVEFRNATQRTLLIKVHRLDNDTGAYTFDVRESR